MMKDLGDQKKIRTYAILKEILLSRASKTLIPGLTLNTKAHLMYFYLIPEDTKHGFGNYIFKNITLTKNMGRQ